ncbi:hypothetical protein [Ekhidna sp.]|uniref:hypothetical protein n=1 Tax=Ekhidna sp. TaxID=2608089 RepID=UPI003CCC2FFB
MRLAIIVFLTLCGLTSTAQLTDLQLIEKAIHKPQKADKRKTHIEVNQFFDTCIYDQKCGVFMSRSFKQFDPIKGFFLSIDRRFRCSALVKSQALPITFNSDGFIVNHAEDYSFKNN